MGVVHGHRGGKKCREEFGGMIYLASTSPRRKRLLKEAGIPFKALKPRHEEKPQPGLSPTALVKYHAFSKAVSVAPGLKEGTVIGSDTIVYFKNKIIGKPKNSPHAIKILSQLQGRRHTVYTGVAILQLHAGKIQKRCVFCEKTTVFLKPMTLTDIKTYFKKINPLDKAGAYAIQSRHNIVQKIQGSFSNAVGLPMETLKKYL